MLPAPLPTLLAIYVVGGITFLPLLLVCFVLLAWLALPHKAPFIDLTTAEDKLASIQVTPDLSLEAKLKNASSDSDVATGYFAVCREYVPGGVNGRPPERKTPAGETIAAESPSVYRDIYRTMFDRKTQAPGLDGTKQVKRARNVFFVVLRSVLRPLPHPEGN